jgi:acyl-CoA hydrolase
LSNSQRALALISIAHPDFREDLSRKAYEMGLVSYGQRQGRNDGVIFIRE